MTDRVKAEAYGFEHLHGPWQANEQEDHVALHASELDAPALGNRVARFPLGDRGLQRARVASTAPDFVKACGGDLEPAETDACGPLAWLRCAIETLQEPSVQAAALAADNEPDPEAYWEMVREVEALAGHLTTALHRARGDI